MASVLQKFDGTEVEDIPVAIHEVLNSVKFTDLIQAGKRIGITCGSRGIKNYLLLIRELVKYVKDLGGIPFLIPAMGSHGGATAEGQIELLKGFGITEESCECHIISSMDTVVVGKTDSGRDVYMSKDAWESDGIILLNRIKAHTSFQGAYESGLLKMATIGLGKRKGADACHSNGYDIFGKILPKYGEIVLKSGKIILGLGIIENAFDKICDIHALLPEEILEQEPNLLLKAKERQAKLNFKNCDVLIIDQIGKEISGAGVDPNVIGRYFAKDMSGGINARMISILDLTEQSHGNFIGTGFADFITKRIVEKMNFDVTYANILTCYRSGGAYIPLIMDSDIHCIQASLSFCVGVDPLKAKIIRVKNTLDLTRISVSEAMLDEVKSSDILELLCEPDFLQFDTNGNLW
jgi:hypothetical protein